MKKAFLTIIAAVAMTLSANAQISIIPKLGVSIANVTDSDGKKSESSDSKIGLQLGVAAEIGINDMFAIQPELLFIQKGGKNSETDNDIPGFPIKAERSLTLSYLEIPVLAKVKFGTEDFKFFAIAGPSIGIAVGGKIKTTVSGFPAGFPSPSIPDADVKFGSDGTETKRMDFGLQFGAGVMYKGFVLDLRYGLGLSNLANDSGDFSSKNRAIGITVGYVFPLGGK